MEGGSCQAVLRGASDAERFAMKAARRAPLVHGRAVSDVTAVSAMDLMNRVLIFIVYSCSGLAFWQLAFRSTSECPVNRASFGQAKEIQTEKADLAFPKCDGSAVF
jgi:hypothetical protein